ncbi:MAG TPA: hypothetical protein VGE68_10095, partial [Sphingomicrobium sp.]
MAEDSQNNSSNQQRALIGAGLAAATAGALFLWRRTMQKDEDGAVISDAPPHVLRGGAARQEQGEETLVGKTVTV